MKKAIIVFLVSCTLLFSSEAQHDEGSVTDYLKVPFALAGLMFLAAVDSVEKVLSYHKTYETDDFDNAAIKYYNRELEKSYLSFLNADGMYTLFESDVKNDLALECIDINLKESAGNKPWHYWGTQRTGYRLNARNRAATNWFKRSKMKDNLHLMGVYFYIYDGNLVTQIINEVTQPVAKNKQSPCMNSVPVELMYEQFFLIYSKAIIDSDDKSKEEWINIVKERS